MEKYDEWPSMQDFTFQDFYFRGNKYELWETGRLIRSGETIINIHCICNGGVHNRTSIDVNLSGNPLPGILTSNIRFDRAVCLPDRIMFYTTAVNSNVQHTTLSLLSSNLGYTRENKFYEKNEPIVASVFTINEGVVKITFTFANPDRLIEFYIDESNLQSNQLTDSELFVNKAIKQLSMGNDGDVTSHLLYEAWQSIRNNSEQLKYIRDYGKFGMGLMLFVTSYDTVTDIDDKQQLASISYLFLSKALAERPTDANLLRNRLLLMIGNHEAFEYTVSSVVNDGEGIIYPNFNPYKARNAMFKMEYADYSKDIRLPLIDMLSGRYIELKKLINNGHFGKNETEESIIESGNHLHKQILEYLENKVIEEGDIDF
ncbi:MAG: hypothetical protein IJV42_05290 [Bacteroidaceae bacterium]|nr:hypothetical protein [Bacteroidaceae bacterium]